MFVMKAFTNWERLTNRKYDYITGERAFDTELFAEAMQQAFDMFCQVTSVKRLPVTSKDVTGSPSVCVSDCCQIIRFMSDYAAYCFAEDESKDMIFTASRYAVTIFLNNLRGHWSFHPDRPILSDDISFSDDERSYPYNVETGDLSGLQKLAQYRASWD